MAGSSEYYYIFSQVVSNRILLDVAASFMNTVILTSVLSAGNHALFAGTRMFC